MNKLTDTELLEFMIRQYGTKADLARALGLSYQAIVQWGNEKRSIPRAWRLYFEAQFEKNLMKDVNK
jgi:DNA-binding XRE family transcriptional regulator